MIEVTAKQVVDTLREVVAERPNFLYERPDPASFCKYVHDGPDGPSPGCVVGHVLARLGVPLYEMLEVEGENATYAMERLLQFPADTKPVNDYAHRLMYYCQHGQDTFKTWGEALSYADEMTTGMVNA